VDEGVHAGMKEPVNNWLPVGLWLGPPGFLGEVNMEARTMVFAMLHSNAEVQVAQIVRCWECATKTHQTVVLTIVVLHSRIGCIHGHCIEQVGHEALPRRNGRGQFKKALRGHKRLELAFGEASAGRRIA
jgi:hypothetical protein